MAGPLVLLGVEVGRLAQHGRSELHHLVVGCREVRDPQVEVELLRLIAGSAG